MLSHGIFLGSLSQLSCESRAGSPASLPVWSRGQGQVRMIPSNFEATVITSEPSCFRW